MKSLFALLLTTLAYSSAHAESTCDPLKVLEQVNASAPNGFAPGPKAQIRSQYQLAPDEKKNVIVMVDDFDFTNPRSTPADLFIIVGSSLASDVTVWAAMADATTCEVFSATEILHTGGGGL